MTEHDQQDMARPLDATTAEIPEARGEGDQAKQKPGIKKYVSLGIKLAFTAAMLFYVISSNTLQMVVGWELVGLCSFALLRHWWE